MAVFERGKVTHLIVDSPAFLKNAPIHDIGTNIYTTPDVINEIKDRATKERLQILPYELILREPSLESIKNVTAFSKKTGDYPCLSAIDICVVALALELHKEFVGTDDLRDEPVINVTAKRPSETLNGPNIMPGFYVPSKVPSSKSGKAKSDMLQESQENGVTSTLETETNNMREMRQDIMDGEDKENPIVEGGNDTEYNGDIDETNLETEDGQEEDDDDDNAGWVAPDNLQEAIKEMGMMSVQDEHVEVACLTTDFAMQNTLIQMGINVVTVGGMLIKRAKTFVLRCFGCFKTTTNMNSKFCAHCGNKTLKRVVVTLDDDGTKHVHINFRRPLNVRGTRYSLPVPKGGKHAMNPILCADQPVPQNRLSKMGRKKTDAFDPDYIAGSSPFVLNDVYSRAANVRACRGNKSGNLKSRNPNEAVKHTGKRKK